jgi:hypothetical protein
LGYFTGYWRSFTWFFSLTAPATLLYACAGFPPSGHATVPLGWKIIISNLFMQILLLPSTTIYIMILIWISTQKLKGNNPSMTLWKLAGFFVALGLHFSTVDSLYGPDPF